MDPDGRIFEGDSYEKDVESQTVECSYFFFEALVKELKNNRGFLSKTADIQSDISKIVSLASMAAATCLPQGAPALIALETLSKGDVLISTAYAAADASSSKKFINDGENILLTLGSMSLNNEITVSDISISITTVRTAIVDQVSGAPFGALSEISYKDKTTVQVYIKNPVTECKQKVGSCELLSNKVRAGYANMPAFNAIGNQDELNKIPKINVCEDLLN